MTEKMNMNNYQGCRFLSGLFKPTGKKEKRRIHKLARRMDLPTNEKGIYSKIGVHFEYY